MPTVKVKDIHMYYEIHGEGESLVFIAGLATDISEYGCNSLTQSHGQLVRSTVYARDMNKEFMYATDLIN